MSDIIHLLDCLLILYDDQSVYTFPLIFHLKGLCKKSLLISISALGVGLDYSLETLSYVRHHICILINAIV